MFNKKVVKTNLNFNQNQKALTELKPFLNKAYACYA